MHWAWLENLTKPFSSLLNPLAERIGQRLGRRKPRLYVHFNPTQLVWGIGTQKQTREPDLEMMHIHLTAGFNHDDDKQTLVIMDAFPEGTQNRMPALSQFEIRPHTLVNQQVVAFVVPVVGEKGKPWTGRFIIVDQFQRRYKTQRATYRWTGPDPDTGGNEQTGKPASCHESLAHAEVNHPTIAGHHESARPY